MIAAPAASADDLVSDSFTRTIAFGGGLGLANVGGAWVTSDNNRFAVNGSAAQVKLDQADNARTARIGPTASDQDLSARFQSPSAATGALFMVNLLGRYKDAANTYRAKVTWTTAGTLTVTVTRVSGGAVTDLATARTAVSAAQPGTWYWVRLQVGGATVRAKVWPDGAPDPDWQVSATDAAPLAAGTAGLRAYANAGNTNLPTLLFDDFAERTLAPPGNTAAPAIAGTAAQGQVLTATPGTWSGAGPVTFAYQWLRCDQSATNCSAISGATATTYTLAKADLGMTLEAAVTGSNLVGSAAAKSAATEPVVTGGPSNTAPPTITGSARPGQTLVGDPGTWASDEPPTFGYQWRRCDATGAACSDVPSSTGSSQPIGDGDVGSTMRFAVTATTAGGATTAVSAATALIAPPPDPFVAAAGDISCDPTSTLFNGGAGSQSACAQAATAQVALGSGAAAVLALGDDQYGCGGFQAFMQAYDPSWGLVKNITHPVPGNHEYALSGGLDCDPTGSASGYFQYFGALAGQVGAGYYSFEVGAWHIVALNSNCSAVGGCGVGSPEETWLKADLAAHPTSCTLAYWHYPRFSSGLSGNAFVSTTSAFWNDLSSGGADVVVNGHDHDYERFAPQTPGGQLAAAGIREFIVGTGGKSHDNVVAVQANSEVRDSTAFGVLRLVLHPTSYDWTFLPTSGGSFTDSGSTPCHA
jgi:hypothetical protein